MHIPTEEVKKAEQAGSPFSKQLTLWHHPDALYDEHYIPVPLKLDSFCPLQREISLTQPEAHCVRLKNGSDQIIQFEAVQKGILRVRISPTGEQGLNSTTESLGLINTDWSGEPLTSSESDASFQIHSSNFGVTWNKDSQDFEVTHSNGDTILESTGGGVLFANDPERTVNPPFFAGFKINEERFFGFGGRTMPPDRTGTTVDIFSVKTGVLKGDYGGFPIPFYLSTRGYGLFLNNPWPHVYFDMGFSNPEHWFLHAPGGQCDFFLIDGPEFSDIIRRFTEIVGRPPSPPKWLQGFWASCVAFDSAEKAIHDADRLRKEKYPCDVFVFDGPWRSGKGFVRAYQKQHIYENNDLQWHEEFGDGPAMIQQLLQRGIKTCLHVNSRTFKPETEEWGIQEGVLRRQEEEVVPRVADPKGERFYENQVLPRIKENVALWWTDHSDRVSGEIKEGIPSRNLFGPLWNRLLSNAMEKYAPQEPYTTLCLSRGGGIGSQRYAIPWPGDTRFGIDAMGEDIWFALSASLTGFPLNTTDLAGFTARQLPQEYQDAPLEIAAEAFDDENICRRLCQMLLFIPIPRIHNSALIAPKFPWNCSSKAQKLYRAFLEERYRLTPYIYSMAIQAAQSGLPIISPLVYHHRLDEEVYSILDELYLGDALLIAPVIEAECDSREVYLPEGEWTNFWTEERHTGPCRIEVPTPLFAIEGLPIFVRAGAILPRQEYTLSLEDTPPQTLFLDVYMGKPGELSLWESPETVQQLSVKLSDGAWKLHLQNRTDAERVYAVSLHHTGNTSTVFQGDKALSTKWDEQRQTLNFEVNMPPQSNLACLINPEDGGNAS